MSVRDSVLVCLSLSVCVCACVRAFLRARARARVFFCAYAFHYKICITCHVAHLHRHCRGLIENVLPIDIAHCYFYGTLHLIFLVPMHSITISVSHIMSYMSIVIVVAIDYTQ